MSMFRENVEAAILSLPMELERIRSELQAGLQSTVNGLKLEGHRSVDPARGLLVAGSGRLTGWSLAATGGAVVVTIRDARSGDGTDNILAEIRLGAGTAETQPFPLPGVGFVEGLHLTKTGPGVLSGSVWTGAAD